MKEAKRLQSPIGLALTLALHLQSFATQSMLSLTRRMADHCRPMAITLGIELEGSLHSLWSHWVFSEYSLSIHLDWPDVDTTCSEACHPRVNIHSFLTLFNVSLKDQCSKALS